MPANAREEKAAAELADKKEKELVQGQKCFDSLNKLIKPLGGDFTQFRDELEGAGEVQGWPLHLLDHDLQEVPLSDLTNMERIHYRNAFLIIRTMTSNTEAGNLLAGIEKNNGRKAFQAIKSYYLRNTVAGRMAQTAKFFNANMATLDCTIISFFSTLHQLGKDLKEAGGDVSDAMMLSVLLNGLLPQFDTIKTILQQREGLTLESAKHNLVDFARANNLDNITKTRARGAGNNTFYAEPNKNVRQTKESCKGQICIDWQRNKCRFGQYCWREHKGPGGNLPRDRGNNFPPRDRGKAPIKDKNTTFTIQDKPQCHLCSGNHDEKNCHNIDTEDRAGLDYVFFSQSISDDGLAPQLSVKDEDDDDVPRTPITVQPSIKDDVVNTIPLASNPKTIANPSDSAAANWIFATMALLTVMAMVIPNIIMAVPDAVTDFFTQANRVIRVPMVKTIFISVIIAMLITQVYGDISSSTSTIQASSFLAHGNTTTGSTFEWCSDSGTNRFVTNNRNDFIEGSEVTSNTKVAVGGGNITSPSYGNILVRSLGHTIMFKDVLYIPECGKKLMPVSPFVRKGFAAIYKDQKVFLQKPDGSNLFQGEEVGGLYYYECETVRGKCAPTNYFSLSAKGTSPSEFQRKLREAHVALGHMHFDKVRKLLCLGKGDNPDCQVCTMSKSTKDPLANKRLSRSTHICHRSHMDIVYSSEHVFHLFVDDHSRKSDIVKVKTKGEALQTWEDHKKMRENEFAPWKHAFVHSDSESIYTSKAFADHCKQENMTHEFSSPYRHDQNGVVERTVRAISTIHRCQMNQGNAPPRETPYSIMHANTIKNNSPTRANKGNRTPMEVETGLKLPPNRHLLRGPIFCLAFCHVYEEERESKGDTIRGVPCVYLGYDQINSNYMLRNWITGEILHRADVTFHPNTFPYRNNPHRTASTRHRYDAMAPAELRDAVAPMQQNGQPPAELRDAVGPMQLNEQPQVQRESQRQRDYRFSGGQALNNIADRDVPPDANNYALTMQAPDPVDLAEALDSPEANEWMVAELKEQNSFLERDVLEIVPRSQAKGKRIFKYKRVLKTKRFPPTIEEPLGPIDKRKIRVTIQAFTKMLKLGIDYAEKYASTVRFETILVLIAIATITNLDIMLTDIATFFLYGDLEDEVYMEQVDEWASEDKPKEDFVCKLKKSMYGLPQASLCAQKKLKKTLLKDGVFKQSTADDCVYVGQGAESDFVALGAHVDDLISVGNENGFKKLIATLRSEFKITIKKNPDVIMGMQIERDRKRGWTKVHQEGYIMNLLKNFGMEDCRSTATPMDPGAAKSLMMLPIGPELTDAKVLKDYQSLVGAMLWLKSRPDMLFTINLLSRFLKNATPAHLAMARDRPLRYLQGTKNWGICFQAGEEGPALSGESDADFAGDLDTSRTTLGVYEKIGEFGTIMCRSSLERKICTSTGQGETYAMQSLTKNVVWTRHLMEDLGYAPKLPTPVFTDNDGVIKQSTKAINHTKAKHYRTAQAYIREKQASGVINVGSVHTSKNAADMLTKALPKEAFVRHRRTIMGPQQPE